MLAIQDRAGGLESGVGIADDHAILSDDCLQHDPYRCLRHVERLPSDCLAAASDGSQNRSQYGSAKWITTSALAWLVVS